MKRLVIAVLLLLGAGAPRAVAEVQLTLLTGTDESLLGGVADLGEVAAGDELVAKLRVRNTDLRPASVDLLTVSGVAFALQQDFERQVLAPGGAYDFGVVFRPSGEGSYSATLRVSSLVVVLRGKSVLGPVIGVVRNAEITDLPSSGLRVEASPKRAATVELAVRNPYGRALPLSPLAVTGEGLSNTALPSTLNSGDDLRMTLTFAPGREGSWEGLLIVGARRIAITCISTEAKLPPPDIITSSDEVQNGKQIEVRLQWPDPAVETATGKMTVAFSGIHTDPAILFENGTREAVFTVDAGSREALFEGDPAIILQTGTTAGTLTLNVTTAGGSVSRSWSLPAREVVLESAGARREGSALEVLLAGFDNSRTAGSLNFRFYDRAGSPLGGTITTSLITEFSSYFQESTVGGIFQLRARFPVSGDATMVGSVDVEIANSIGRTVSQRLPFP